MSNHNGPSSRYPGLRLPQAVVDESADFLRRVTRLPQLWARAQDVKKGATPSEVVYQEDRLRLLHYTSPGPVKFQTPLLFVFALVNRPYILDIVAGKSVVEHFVRAGFDTYLVDWGVPSHADRHNTLHDYLDGYLLHVVEHLRGRCGVPQVSMLGYCMGGTMGAMFTALYPQWVKNLILLAAGIDFSTRGGLLNLWCQPEYFDVDAFVDAWGNCPAQFLQTGFLLLKPVANLIEKPLALWERLDDDRFVDEYLTMETWLADNIPVAGETFRQFVKGLYQQNLLVQNRMRIGRRVVDLKQITCPVLNLMASRDDLVPCAQSEPFNDLVSSSDRRTIKLDVGHIGLAMGTKAQEQLWPEATRWLAQRS
ncbi:MAG: class III poly(R)-hydroxyalkanoic acid synthase subunit PhaC [Thermoguttaceae bacterium]